jgi:hypothetical protein
VEEIRRGGSLSMAGKIFYRERQRYVDGAEHPRFLLVAVHDLDIKVYAQHLRMSELKAIAEATGAELIALPRGAPDGMGALHGGRKHRDATEARAR